MIVDFFGSLVCCGQLISVAVVNVRTYDYVTLVQSSTVITQQIMVVGIFVAVFLYVFHSRISSTTLLSLDLVLGIVGFIYYNVPGMRYLDWILLKSAFIFLCGLLGLSPVLMTLTRDTSSDTVWAVSVILFSASLLMHDYSSTAYRQGYPRSTSCTI